MHKRIIIDKPICSDQYSKQFGTDSKTKNFLILQTFKK